MNLGRVTGNRVLETRFRTDWSEKVMVGEMLVVEDSSSGDIYLVRVMDVEHGAEMNRDDWITVQAGEVMQEDLPVTSLQGRIFCTGVCSPLGQLSDGRFRKTKTIPSHFSIVRRARPDDYDFLKEHLGDIEVGRLRSGDRVLDLPVGIPGAAIPHHIGIFATTGMGKSNLMKDLALSCMSGRRYGFLVLDPHGEYYDGGEVEKRGLVHARNDALEVFSSRELSGPYNTLHIAASEIEVEDLKNLYEFSPAQIECLQSAQYKYGSTWLIELNQRKVSTVSSDLGEKFHEGTINVIKRRLDNIFRFGLLTTDPKLSVTGHIIDCLHAGKVVLVDTSNMYEAEELLISTVLARAIFERHKTSYASREGFSRIPPVLIALEEAQRVLSEPKGTIFAQIAREGRKFRVGLCAVSQQPKLIDNEIISQFNTLFILGLADKRDRDILKNSAKQDVSQLENEIQMLMPGEALIASPFTPFAVPVMIHLYEELVEAIPATHKERKRPDLSFF